MNANGQPVVYAIATGSHVLLADLIAAITPDLVELAHPPPRSTTLDLRCLIGALADTSLLTLNPKPALCWCTAGPPPNSPADQPPPAAKTA